MTARRCFLLLLFAVAGSVDGFQGRLLNISSPVAVIASSSSSYSTSRIQFAPQLAIQADTGRQWSTCFISTNETNPWFKVEFKSVTSIFHVRLGVRPVGGGYLPHDYNLEGMDGLTVYVSNSSTLDSSDQQRCGDPWKYESEDMFNILRDCGKQLTGLYLYVTVPSTSPTYLLICSMVLNRENGSSYPLNLSANRATVSSSGASSSRPSELAIDGSSSIREDLCSSFSGSDTTWLRVDIQAPRYIREVRLLFIEGSGADAAVIVGRSLRGNGASDNARCGTVASSMTGSQWQNLTCPLPILGQFIYIERKANTMRVCEIELFYDNIMNIYSSVNVTASDQSGQTSAIWKPVDGIKGKSNYDSWISSTSSKSWWRLELPRRSAISSVVIYPRRLDTSTRRSQMDGFVVYVGDLVNGNGSMNAICGMPWAAPSTKVAQITMECPDYPVGKYLYVAAAQRSGARLYLSEIEIYECAVPVQITMISSSQTIDFQSTALLQCTVVGCPYITIEWTGSNRTVLPTSRKNGTSTVTSTLNVTIGEAAQGGGQYMCTATNAERTDTSGPVVLSVLPKIISPPVSIAIAVKSTAELKCTAAGYPTVGVVWMDPQGKVAMSKSTLRAGNQVTSIVLITNKEGADGGGRYTCTASNSENAGESSDAVVTVYPDIVMYSSNGLTVKDGIDAGHLQCVTNAYPKPTITWKRNDITISDSLMDLNYDVSNRFGSDLDVGTVSLSDNGTVYFCVVTQGSTVVNDSVILIVEPDAAFTLSPQSVVGVVGGEVTLTCGANGRSVKVFNWTVNSTNILADGAKYSIVPNGKQSTLTIKQLQLSDGTAEYRCIAGAAVKPNILISKSAMISVLGEITSFNDKAYDIGGTVDDSFSCLFTAYPKPNVLLQQDGKLVAGTSVQSKGSFMYSVNLPSMAVTVNTSGLYRCVVSYFGASVKLNRTAQLQIFPTATITPTAAVTITTPRTVQLRCVAVGFPVPSVTWFHSRRSEVANVTDHSSPSSDSTNRQTVSILKFADAYLNAGGEYKCVATSVLQKNGMAANFTSASTLVQVSPEVSGNSGQVDAVRGSSVHLTCTATGYPAPDFTWKFNDKLMARQDTQKNTSTSLSSLILRNVNAISHGGLYKCEASNSAAPSDSATIAVKFTPKVVTPPVSVGVAYLQDLTLTCMVSSYPALNKVTWYRNGRQINASSSAVVMQNISALTSRLTMKSVTEVACGNYSCYSMDSQTAVVTVGSEAFLNTNTTSVVEGDTFAVECRAVGCPPPSIIWQFRRGVGESISIVRPAGDLDRQSQVTSSSASKSILTFKNISHLRTGMYRCRSANGIVKVGYSGFTTINVYYVSSFLVSLNVTVDEGASFQLSCTPQGNPLLSAVRWKKAAFVNFADEQQVPNNQRIVVAISDASVTLNVAQCITADSGWYLCQFPGVSSFVRSDRIHVVIRGRPAGVDASTVEKQSIYSRNFTLMWSKPFDGFSSILYYIIDYKDYGAANFTFLRNINATSNTSTVSVAGLQPHTLYIIRIVPVNRLGEAAGEDPVQVTTAVAYPSAPRNLNVSVTSSTSLFASWEKPETPNGPIDAYNVYFQIVDAAGERVVMSLQITDMFVTSANITGLKKFTMYKVSVRAANKAITASLEGPTSNFVEIQTAQDVPSAPVSLSIGAVDDTSLHVTWLPPLAPNGIIMFYQVFIAESVTSVSATQNISANATKTVIKGLTAYTTYTAIVRAFTIDFGNFSLPADGSTDEGFPSAPQQLRVQSADATTVTLEWNSPEYRRGVIVNYVVHYRSMKTYVDTGGEQRQETIDEENFTNKPTTSFTVRDLPANFTFMFSVVAVTGRGRGDASIEVQVKTPIGSPESPIAPIAPMDSPKTMSTLTLTLIKPSNRNGAIGSVLLFVAQLTGDQVASEVDFANAVAMPYSEESRTGTLIYVAAQFDYDNFPTTFVLGDDMMYGGYRNQPLIAGTRYAYALRSLSAANTALFTTSGAAEAATAGAATESSSSIAIIAGAIGVVVLAILVVILIIVIIQRKKTRKEEYAPSVSAHEDGGKEDVAMSEFVKPTVSAVSTEIDSNSGSVAVLRVNVTGWPKPKIVWRSGGNELPGKDSRFDLLADGSLQITGLDEHNTGLYRCTVSNKVGSAQCQVKLRVHARAEKKDPVAMSDFEQHVEEMHDNRDHGFSLEYSLLDRDVTTGQLAEAAKRECNRAKNRYGNILPFDQTRVVLEELPNVPGSDYINASYLDAYDQPKGYIACQGPMISTIKDFWRMIWQESVPTIVMVTNLEERGKEKCSCYWPQLKNDDRYGDITVSFREESILSESTIRTFKLTNSEEEGAPPRLVTQFHFTGWPDHGVPSYVTSLLNFVKRVRSHHDRQKSGGPVAVHCSAGIGRTGTFIIVDYTLQKLKQERKADIFNLVLELRKQRPCVVQTEAQYIFCHDSVMEFVLCGDTSVSAPNLTTHICKLAKVDPVTGKTGYDACLELLSRVSPERRKFSYSGGRQNVNSGKHRYKNCIPPDQSRVTLLPVAGLPSDCTYISAGFVDGYRQKKMYVTTQGPLEHTVEDFWRLVWEKECQLIAMVTQLEENGQEMSVQYWPSEGSAEYGLISVTKIDEKLVGDYAIRKFKLENNKTSAQRIIMQFQYFNWLDGQLPGNPSQLLHMMNQIERAQQQAENKAVVVMCSDGVHRSGLFCAISNIIESLKTEQVVDVFQVVKALRLHNPDFLSGLEEYKFCYDICLEFLDSFDDYANFKSL